MSRKTEHSALFSAYKLYAIVLEEASSVLSSTAFADFVSNISDELSPLTIQQHLTAPMDAAQRLSVQLKAVLDMTPAEHPDKRWVSCPVLSKGSAALWRPAWASSL